MNLDYFINRLSVNRGVFESLLRDVPAEQAIWKPSPEKWSMLEVVNHLYDEEREDFRARLELTLKDPSEPWPPIDPPGWVTARKYGERELGPSLDSFLGEREKSLSWLKGLTAPHWENRHEVSGRARTAGDVIASWLAHDFLHIRQLTRLHWQYVGVSPPRTKLRTPGPGKKPDAPHN